MELQALKPLQTTWESVCLVGDSLRVEKVIDVGFSWTVEAAKEVADSLDPQHLHRRAIEAAFENPGHPVLIAAL